MKIGIQNFQGITTYQEIELKQLCLLYGKNSSGKSTILDAITVGQNIFSKGSSALPSKWVSTIKKSEQITETETILFFEGNNSFAFFEWYDETFKTSYDPSSNDSPAKHINESLNPFGKLSIELRWELTNGAVELTKYKVSFDEIPALEWRCDHQGVGTGTIYKDNEFIESVRRSLGDHSWEYSPLYKNCTQITDKTFTISFRIDRFNGSTSQAFDSLDFICLNHDDPLLFLIYFLVSGTAYWLSQEFHFDTVQAVRSISSTAFTKDALQQSSIDDPLRHESFLNTAFLYKAEKEEPFFDLELEIINEFLSSPRYLDTGFVFSSDIKFLLNQEQVTKLSKMAEEDRGTFLRQLPPESVLSKIVLFDLAREKIVDLDDIGVGISQILPVLISAMTSQKAFIQQPELHLHPKMQASMADIFIAAANRYHCGETRSFILETHSELLALRVLRRIAETNRSHIKDKYLNIYPKDVSVVFFDRDAHGAVTLTNLRISADGDFIDRWPNGFFAERDAELFYD